jgi:hypothetical protein
MPGVAAHGYLPAAAGGTWQWVVQVKRMAAGMALNIKMGLFLAEFVTTKPLL